MSRGIFCGSFLELPKLGGTDDNTSSTRTDHAGRTGRTLDSHANRSATYEERHQPGRSRTNGRLGPGKSASGKMTAAQADQAFD